MTRKHSEMNLKELLNLCIKKSLPFYSYRLPEQTDIHTGVQLNSSTVSTSNLIDPHVDAFNISPFYNSSNEILRIIPQLTFINEEIDENVNEIFNSIHYQSTHHTSESVEIDKNEYLSQVAKLIDVLKKEELRKVVLSRATRTKICTKNTAAEAFLQLTNTYPGAFVSIFYTPEYGLWMGATPEKLVNHSAAITETVSLAATKLTNDSRSWSEKEIDEQQLVSDFVKEVLNQFPFENIAFDKTKDKPAGAITHLITEFSCKGALTTEQVTSLIMQLHPTPAVCGFPKQKALDVIIETEKHDRELYAGFIGPTDKGCAQLFVNLRCMKLTENEAILYAGGGLTALSDPQSEWEETCLKLETLTKAIKIHKC
jgi:isochorismate synthase